MSFFFSALFATALWRLARGPVFCYALFATALWRLARGPFILVLSARDLFVLKKLTYEFLYLVMVN